MLRELRIRNFAVIESVAVEFRPGLNVLTGETGAGKSMLIDAILLVLGARAQTDVIRSDADAATVEAVFDVEPRGAVAATLDEAGLAPDDGVLVARRELSRSGRHRAFVNDAAVTVALLERLGDHLVEVHGQHEHQRLLEPARQLELLDRFADAEELRERVAPPREAHPRRPGASRSLEGGARRADRRGSGAARRHPRGGPSAPRVGAARARPPGGDRRAARRAHPPQAEIRRYRGGDAQVPRRGPRRARPALAPRGDPRGRGAAARRAPGRARSEEHTS